MFWTGHWRAVLQALLQGILRQQYHSQSGRVSTQEKYFQRFWYQKKYFWSKNIFPLLWFLQLFWQHDVKFTLPPEIQEKRQTVEEDSDENDEGEKIGFVQHLSSTKRFQFMVNCTYKTNNISLPRLLPFERYSQLCKMSCCLEDNARLFPKVRKFV